MFLCYSGVDGKKWKSEREKKKRRRFVVSDEEFRYPGLGLSLSCLGLLLTIEGESCLDLYAAGGGLHHDVGGDWR